MSTVVAVLLLLTITSALRSDFVLFAMQAVEAEKRYRLSFVTLLHICYQGVHRLILLYSASACIAHCSLANIIPAHSNLTLAMLSISLCMCAGMLAATEDGVEGILSKAITGSIPSEAPECM